LYYQHERTPYHFRQAAKQHLNLQFRNLWIGRGSTINWPQTHRIPTRCITMCGVIWTLWCLHWTRDKYYFANFLALQDA
jgi:hypothetical protein